MGVLDLRSIWEYDKVLGNAIRHYCEYTMAAERFLFQEKPESFLFWFKVSASGPVQTAVHKGRI